MDYKQLRPQTRRLIFAGANPDFWKMEKQLNPNTAKKTRATYLDLKQKIERDHNQLFKSLGQRLEAKLENLLHN